MNKLIHTAPPSALSRWLARSVCATLACVGGCRVFWHYAVGQTLAFAPGLGATSMPPEGRVAHDMTVLTTLVMVAGYFLFVQTALPGFTAAYASGKHQYQWLDNAAFGWWITVNVLKVAWLVFAVVIVFGCLLSVNDEGRTWN